MIRLRATCLLLRASRFGGQVGGQVANFLRGSDGDLPAGRPSGILVFATGLSLATVALIWLAWTANGEMRRSTGLLLERRASEVLALTSAALNRDMKGAWLSVLVPLDATAVREDPPYDLLQLTSRAFARFPYPESFIVWTASEAQPVSSEHERSGFASLGTILAGPASTTPPRTQRVAGTPAGGASSEPVGRTYAFNRSDRPLPWDASDRKTEPYPVTLVRNPPALEPLVARIRQDAQYRRRFALVEMTFQGVPYQVIVHFMFQPPDKARLSALVAFTVNLDWVRREYLGDLLREVATIDGEQDAMAISVLDETRRLVARSGAPSTMAPVRQRTFPLLFIEPSLISGPPLVRPTIREWTVEVRPAADAVSAAAALGTQMLLLASLAGAASLIAVLMTVRAVRVSSELATMKSEFVSAVTHELKTPLALIKLVGETLERGRYTSPDTIRDYAAILSQEERRLSHLIENLLTYSRLSELRQMQTDEPVDLCELVEDALEPFRPRLQEQGFQLGVQLDPELPHVRADRMALQQVFSNLIDNAIKYSPEQKTLEIEARTDGDRVRVTFTDTGAGIPAEELPKVFEKFYRGRHAREFGSGLGLAIVRRIVQQHHGALEVDSTVGRGTTVAVILPGLERA
jgi:signal transduction histidine kinase